MEIQLEKYKNQVCSSILLYNSYIRMLKNKYLLPIYLIAYIPFFILVLLEIVVISIVLLYLLICIGLRKIHILKDDDTKIKNRKDV